MIVNITYEQLLSLTGMLNAGDDDFEVAKSNIENLKLDVLVLNLFYKNIKDIRRKVEFRNEFNLLKEDLSINKINIIIRMKNKEYKDFVLNEYFRYTVLNIYKDSFNFVNRDGVFDFKI